MARSQLDAVHTQYYVRTYLVDDNEDLAGSLNLLDDAVRKDAAAGDDDDDDT